MPISRRAALLLFVALAGCGRGGDAPSPSEAPGARVAGTTPPGAATIGCAIGRDVPLALDCTIERSRTPAGLALVLRQPGGGFRRLLVTADGRGVIAADGAERASVRVTGPREIEVAVAGERYRLPATLRGGPLPVAAR